jgi:IS5 family transposase
MRNLTDFALRLEYERVKDLGDKLVDIGGRLNWESFRPALEAMYRNKPNAAADRISM